MVEFRKESLEKVTSPDSLHDYLQVTNPRLWMLLAVITALLIGLIVLACTATMENTMDLTVTIKTYDENTVRTAMEQENMPEGDYTSVTAVQPLSMKDTLSPGMKLRVVGEEGELLHMYTTPEDQDLGLVFQMEKAVLGVPDGDYDAVLVLESVTPISFLLN